MKTLVLFLILASTAFAAELTPEMNSLIVQLDADEFDVREQAELRLGEAPAEYVNVFLAAAKASESPETRRRLFRAAQAVFLSKVLPTTHEWKALHGDLGVEITQEYTTNSEDQPYVMKVTSKPTGGAEGKLEQDDVIVEVNGVKMLPNYGYSGETIPSIRTADAIVTFVVKRYKYVEKDGEQVEAGAPEMVTVEVKVGWRETRHLDDSEQRQVSDLKRQAWRKFLFDEDDSLRPRPLLP